MSFSLPPFRIEDDAFIGTLHRYFDGALTPEESCVLAAELRGSELRREQFVFWCLSYMMMVELESPDGIADVDDEQSTEEQVYRRIITVLREDQAARAVRAASQANEFACEEVELHHLPGHGNETNGSAERSFMLHIVIPRPLFYGGVAAVLGVLLALLWPSGLGAWFFGQSELQRVDTIAERSEGIALAAPQATASAAASGHSGAAVVRRVHRARFVDPVEPGTQWSVGESFELLAGYAEVQLARGATAILEGPCKGRVVSDNEIELIRGNVVAQVPDSAHGFTVITPMIRVVDLGTRFNVEVWPSGAAHVAVYEGAVQVHGYDDAAGPRPLILGEGWQVGANADGVLDTVSQRLDAQARSRFRAWEAIEAGYRLRGQVERVIEAPETIATGRWESENIRVLLERRDVQLKEDLHVVRGHSAVPAQTVTIPAGTRVDSYLIHYDPPGEPRRPAEARATIDFDRPVLGLLTDLNAIADTHATFGRSDVLYPGPEPVSGLEDVDTVQLTHDGQRLRLHWHCQGHADRIRVLVEVP